MGRIILWKGHHSAGFAKLFRETWHRDDQLLIACPPVLQDFSFLDQLPPGEVFFAGDWQLPLPANTRREGARGYPARPRFGVFTTGTTRDLPKLILYTKENIASCQAEILKLFDTSRISKVFSYPQPYYVFGLTLGYAMAEINGWELIAPEGSYTKDHHRAWLAEDCSALMTLATPAHVSDLVSYVIQQNVRPRVTYTCILGGAKVNRQTWLAARDQLGISAPSIGYGCAEAAPGVSHLSPGHEPEVDGEIGSALGHLKIDVLDEGGIKFSGPSLCLATIENGIIDFPTEMTIKDRVTKQEDGSMVFSARTDMLLNRGGEKFSLEHIEAAMKRELGVDAICVAMPDQRLGQELGVLMRKSQGVASEQIYAMLEKAFGRRFDAKRFKEVEALPLNDNSKPDRKNATLQLSAQLRHS
jgi:acyl-CoA synthetase (AMP-forming)/AMP-acid ligase II